jgi:hypothetical protein
MRFSPKITIYEEDRKWYVHIGDDLVPDSFSRLSKAKAFVYAAIDIAQKLRFKN